MRPKNPNLYFQNTYLTGQHLAIRNIVEKLMDTDLLAKQNEWKKGIKDIRDIIEKVYFKNKKIIEFFFCCLIIVLFLVNVQRWKQMATRTLKSGDRTGIFNYIRRLNFNMSKRFSHFTSIFLKWEWTWCYGRQIYYNTRNLYYRQKLLHFLMHTNRSGKVVCILT